MRLALNLEFGSIMFLSLLSFLIRSLIRIIFALSHHGKGLCRAQGAWWDKAGKLNSSSYFLQTSADFDLGRRLGMGVQKCWEGKNVWQSVQPDV